MSAHARVLVAATALLALSACGGAARNDSEAWGATIQPVFGGAPAPNDTAVVAVINFAGGQCSGSLIAPNLVLTARHCVADSAKKEVQVVCGETPFKAPKSAGAIWVVPLARVSEDPDDYLAVAEIRMAADQDADLCGTDVALLRLKEPLAGVAPLDPRVAEPVVASEPYSVVGFGRDESLADAPSGERKRLDELEVVCGRGDCPSADVRSNEWVGSGGPCQGDSGGPALDAEGRVIGVVSRGNAGCTDPVFSDVATRAAWLQNEAVLAARSAGQKPPAWACDANHPCPEPDSGPEETCAFAVPRPGGVLRASWLGALLLLWGRRRRPMFIRPKRRG